ncbi:hypothetical protein [Limimaricola sp.]|uniref:hypothetical protein n=1 Tax=Limimaricola sp. TaxID=2211665 RepID=UPI00405A48EA
MVDFRTAAILILAGAAAPALAQDREMSFFITSANPGQGADLGGLEGADAYCNDLAAAAGASGEWRAYLSTPEENARDRIGAGPWFNAEGVEIAADLDALHGEGNAISKETGLDETGAMVNGRGDSPNRHDILTGSMPDGTAAAETCEGWTTSGEGSAMVGHHDRMGLDDSAAAKSWNASHPSRGCGLEALQGTGGDGLFYCFAAN